MALAYTSVLHATICCMLVLMSERTFQSLLILWSHSGCKGNEQGFFLFLCITSRNVCKTAFSTIWRPTSQSKNGGLTSIALEPYILGSCYELWKDHCMQRGGHSWTEHCIFPGCDGKPGSSFTSLGCCARCALPWTRLM